MSDCFFFSDQQDGDDRAPCYQPSGSHPPLVGPCQVVFGNAVLGPRAGCETFVGSQVFNWNRDLLR